jgi:hypothetical protein
MMQAVFTRAEEITVSGTIERIDLVSLSPTDATQAMLRNRRFCSGFSFR